MKYSKSEQFRVVLVFFILGVFLASYFEVFILSKIYLVFNLFLLMVLGLIVFYRRGSWRFVILIFMFLLLGILRYGFFVYEDSKNLVSRYNGESIEFWGVVRKVESMKSGQRAVLGDLYNSDNEKEVEGKVLVTIGKYPEMNYGMRINLECKLMKPEAFNGFDYDRFLKKQGIYSVCGFVRVLRIEEGGGFLMRRVFDFRKKISLIIDKGLVEPQGGILKAILLGEKKEVSKGLRGKFSEVGIGHMVAISGMHFTVIISIFVFTFLFLGWSRGVIYYLMFLILVVYLVMIGMPASAMRAAFMAVFILYGIKIGRVAKSSNSILLAAFLLLCWNPMFLRDDVGFQLSFLAVLGIILVYPEIRKKIDKPECYIGRYIFDVFWISVIVQIFTLPVIVSNFGGVSILAFLINILVIWSLPFVIGISMIGVFLSLIVFGLEVYLFLPVDFLLRYLIFIVDMFYERSLYLKFSFNEFWTGVYYICLFFIVRRMKNCNEGEDKLLWIEN